MSTGSCLAEVDAQSKLISIHYHIITIVITIMIVIIIIVCAVYSCLCVMCELSRIPACVTDVAKLLPCLAAAASHHNYSHHVFFLQSVCKQVLLAFPIIFYFKKYIIMS